MQYPANQRQRQASAPSRMHSSLQQNASNNSASHRPNTNRQILSQQMVNSNAPPHCPTQNQNGFALMSNAGNNIGYYQEHMSHRNVPGSMPLAPHPNPYYGYGYAYGQPLNQAHIVNPRAPLAPVANHYGYSGATLGNQQAPLSSYEYNLNGYACRIRHCLRRLQHERIPQKYSANLFLCYSRDGRQRNSEANGMSSKTLYRTKIKW